MGLVADELEKVGIRVIFNDWRSLPADDPIFPSSMKNASSRVFTGDMGNSLPVPEARGA